MVEHRAGQDDRTLTQGQGDAAIAGGIDAANAQALGAEVSGRLHGLAGSGGNHYIQKFVRRKAQAAVPIAGLGHVATSPAGRPKSARPPG